MYGRQVNRILYAILCSFLVLVVLTSCAATTPDSELSRTEESDVLKGAFSDNTNVFGVQDSDEQAVVHRIVSALKGGYEKGDLTSLELALSPDFEFWMKASDGKVLVDDRDEFLRQRAWWSSGLLMGRSLLYSIRSIEKSAEGNNIAVSAFSTYQSKYFSPRFFEMLVFERIGDGWFLKLNILIPLHPKGPGSNNVQIFVADRQWPLAGPRSLSRQLQASSNEKGVDWIVEQFRKTELRKSIPEDELYRSVLMVFREPPPPGTEVIVEHQWESPGWTGRPARLRYIVPAAQSFFMIENQTATGGSGNGTLKWSVVIDNTIVAERTLRRVTKTRSENELERGLAVPKDLAIHDPTSRVPERYRSFLGYWGKGEWNNSVPGAVVIEEVDEFGNALGVIAISEDLRNFGAKKSTKWRVPVRWDRFAGKITDDGILTVSNIPRNGAYVRFKIRKNNQMKGTYIGKNGEKYKAVFEKVKGEDEL